MLKCHAALLTCDKAGQGAHTCARCYQRSFVSITFILWQYLFQPLIHGDSENPVTDLLTLVFLAQIDIWHSEWMKSGSSNNTWDGWWKCMSQLDWESGKEYPFPRPLRNTVSPAQNRNGLKLRVHTRTHSLRYVAWQAVALQKGYLYSGSLSGLEHQGSPLQLPRRANNIRKNKHGVLFPPHHSQESQIKLTSVKSRKRFRKIKAMFCQPTPCKDERRMNYLSQFPAKSQNWFQFNMASVFKCFQAKIAGLLSSILEIVLHKSTTIF